jgi:PRTRC genetic system ThiF family protein
MKIIKVPPYLVNGVHRITVNVVGAGGTGSLILTKLARLHNALLHLDHPGLYVKLIDYDLVEAHNVGRQMFTKSDIGTYKSDTLISKVNASFGFDWESSHYKYHQKDSDCNIMYMAVDNVDARINMFTDFYTKSNNNTDTKKRFFLIDCGNKKDSGQVILSDQAGKLKNISDFAPNWKEQDTEEEQGVSCSYIESLNKQDLFVNDWVSLLAVNILKELLLNKAIDYQGYFFNIPDGMNVKIKL